VAGVEDDGRPLAGWERGGRFGPCGQRPGETVLGGREVQVDAERIIRARTMGPVHACVVSRIGMVFDP
jgi:hypothetical protein